MASTLIYATAILTTLSLPTMAEPGNPGAQFMQNWDTDEDGYVTLDEARDRREAIFFRPLMPTRTAPFPMRNTQSWMRLVHMTGTDRGGRGGKAKAWVKAAGWGGVGRVRAVVRQTTQCPDSRWALVPGSPWIAPMWT